MRVIDGRSISSSVAEQRIAGLRISTLYIATLHIPSLHIPSLHISSLHVASLPCIIEDVAARLPVPVADEHVGVGGAVAVRIVTKYIG